VGYAKLPISIVLYERHSVTPSVRNTIVFLDLISIVAYRFLNNISSGYAAVRISDLCPLSATYTIVSLKSNPRSSYVLHGGILHIDAQT
jgi:hypothetical protein